MPEEPYVCGECGYRENGTCLNCNSPKYKEKVEEESPCCDEFIPDDVLKEYRAMGYKQ